MAIEFHRDDPWELLKGWVWAGSVVCWRDCRQDSPPPVRKGARGEGNGYRISIESNHSLRRDTASRVTGNTIAVYG